MTLTQIKNKFWYNLGYELFNMSKDKKMVRVRKVDGKQVRSNKRRKHNYSLDDKGWCRVIDYPELFL